MATTKNLSTLEIHKLTQDQYDRLAAGEISGKTINTSAIYLIPEADDESSLGIEVVVTTNPNATVYCIDEDNVSISKTADANGKAMLSIPKYGDYTLYAELNGKQSSHKNITFDTAQLYEVSLVFYKTYGVKIAKNTSNPTSAVTYTDDAVGMSTGYDAWKDTPIFKNIKPCVLRDGVVRYYLQKDNYSLKEDGSASTLTDYSHGDVMVEIPKLGYKMTQDDNYHYIQVTAEQNVDGFCYAAHSKNTEGDCDKIYIGAYLGYIDNMKLYSLSGKAVSKNISLTNFRSYATARGDGYELFSFYPLTLLQCLFLIMFKDRDGQTALGPGFTDWTSSWDTGSTDLAAFTYGSTASSASIKFLGIEDFWGNLYQWVDGIRSNSSYDILTYYKNMSDVDNGSNYQYKVASGVSKTLGGYISDIVGGNNGGFVPKSVDGSSSACYTDFGNLFNGYCAYSGGAYSVKDSGGVFSLCVSHGWNDASQTIGARLLYKHVAP